MSKLLFRVIVLSAVLCIFAPGQSAWAAIEDGLISYWPFDEGSGTIAEDAVGDNDGTINGGAAWVTGKFGTALSFDGADGGQENHGSSETDHVDCGSDASLKPTSAVSISAWIKTDEYVYYGQIAGLMTDTGSNEDGYAILTEENGYLGAWLTGSSGDGWYLWTTDVPAYPNVDWVHIALTYDGAESILYVNGDPKDTSDHSGDIVYDDAGNFLIGLYDDPLGDYWWPYEGLIDEVGVWGRALTPAEITELYNGTGSLVSLHVVKPITPINGAIYVPIDTDLSWTEPVDFTADYYDLYFGKDPNEGTLGKPNPNYNWVKKLDKQDQNSWDPPDGPDSGDLALDTTYYWQVDVYDPNNGEQILHVGPKWSFTTIGTYPVVLTHPQGQVSDEVGDAEFTVAGLNIEDYQWYKSVDPNNDTIVDDTPKGTNSDTLTLTGTGLSDEGYYYCKVSNVGGTPFNTAYSDVAMLMTRRKIGHWTYDAEDLSDSSSSGNNGTAVGDPNFATGQVGAFALNLDGDDYVTIDGVAADLIPNNDITMSAWVKTAGNGELLVCNTDDGGNVILLDIDDGVAAGYPFVSGTTTVSDDSWHLLTFVRDGADVYIYVDGEQENAETASFSFSPTDLWSIGQEWDGGPTASDFLTGQVDDSRVYNYALDKYQVADLYLDVEGGWVCPEIDEFDVTGPTPGVPDCVVDILDLREFAKQWLGCGRTPQSACNPL